MNQTFLTWEEACAAANELNARSRAKGKWRAKRTRMGAFTVIWVQA